MTFDEARVELIALGASATACHGFSVAIHHW